VASNPHDQVGVELGTVMSLLQSSAPAFVVDGCAP
jgi:hypothetical protein